MRNSAPKTAAEQCASIDNSGCRSAFQRNAAYLWVWPLLVVATICVASANTIEAPFMPPTLIPKDKIAHLAVFGLIATLIYRALPLRSANKRGISANLCSLIAIGATAVFGISDEIHQSFTPGRMADLYDLVADISGATIAVCAYRWLPFYRNALEWRLVPCCKKIKTDNTPRRRP